MVTLSRDSVSGVARRGGRANTPATAAAADAADGPFVFIVTPHVTSIKPQALHVLASTVSGHLYSGIAARGGPDRLHVPVIMPIGGKIASSYSLLVLQCLNVYYSRP